MDEGNLHILLVEDNPGDADLLQEGLAQVGNQPAIAHVERLEQALEYLQQGGPVDCILLDLGLPDSQGLATLQQAHGAATCLPIIVLTGLEDEALGIEAIRNGAQDYLLKGQTPPRMLMRAVRHAIERKHMEDALRESQARLATFAGATFEGIGESEAGRIVDCNEQLARMLGYSVEELRGMEIAHLVVGEDRERVMANIGQGRESTIEHAMFRKDGTRIVVETHGGPVSPGSVRRLTAIRDITDRKRAEEARRQVTELRELAENAGRVGSFERDFAAGRVRVSPEFLAIYGITPENWDGRHETWIKVIQPEDRPRIEGIYATTFAARTERFEIEFRIARPDGEIRWLEGRARVAYDSEGSPVRIVGVNVDITERKRLEAHQALLADVLLLFNRGGELRPLVDEMLRLIRAATGFEAVGLRLRESDDCPYFAQEGFAEEFLREENLLCLRNSDGTVRRDPEGLAVLQCTCGLVLSAKTDPHLPCFTARGSSWTNASHESLSLPPEMDLRTNPRNRCIHCGYESVGLFPVRAGKAIIGLLQLNDRRPGRFSPELIAFYETLAQNIGLAIQRVASEEALRHAKAVAEQANRAKDHFLAVLSHELRTPLTPVVMGVSMLQDRTDLAPAVRETLEMIGRSVAMEARLIDDLLDVSRIAQGKIELHKQRVDLCAVIRQAAEVCKPDIEARRLAFGVDLGLAAPYWVEVDASRLQQVFWNLVKNAIKFTPHDGCVGIRCRPDRDHVLVEVNDSGIGMEQDALTRVFNAFEQEERSVTRQFGGLGLGLAISKALVEMHGGTIEARSEGRNKGATFRIRLPLASPVAQQEAQTAVVASPVAVRPLRVLLVEDHPVTAKMMRTVLNANGHVVQWAGDVATALELAEQHAFDLLVSDLGLPDGSGHDLMRQLRQRGHNFPGIALSGYGQGEDIQRSLEAGFAVHLTKPASREAVVEAVVKVTGAERGP